MRDATRATRTSDRSRARLRTLRTVLLILGLALLAAACSGDQSALDPRGSYARDPHNLFKVVFFIAVGVFILVQGLIIVAAVKFRQRKDDDSLPVQVHGNTRLEILWTVIPALIMAGIAVPTVKMVFDLAAEPNPHFLEVEVIGHRWWWEYRYPVQPEFGITEEILTANEIVFPVDTPVRLSMTAEEAGGPRDAVIHSFWIPALAGKRDVVPGRITNLNMQADEPGRYLGQCAEYCGLSHANMRARAVAMDDADWRAWVANQLRPVEAPAAGLAAEGADFFLEREGGQRTCVACHAIKGLTGPSPIGPNLTHLMSREEFAGAIFDLTEEELRRWLQDPTAMKPMQPEFGIGMPDLNLTPAEIDALVAFLMTLE